MIFNYLAHQILKIKNLTNLEDQDEITDDDQQEKQASKKQKAIFLSPLLLIQMTKNKKIL